MTTGIEADPRDRDPHRFLVELQRLSNQLRIRKFQVADPDSGLLSTSPGEGKEAGDDNAEYDGAVGHLMKLFGDFDTEQARIEQGDIGIVTHGAGAIQNVGDGLLVEDVLGVELNLKLVSRLVEN